MIQRIQTLYLLAAGGLFFALLFLPLTDIQSGDVFYSFSVAGLYTTASPTELVYPTWSLLTVAAIIILLSFITVFMYGKRVFQIRLCVYNALLMIGFCGLYGFYLWQFRQSPELPDMKISLRFWTCFPLVALILDYLAIRSIGADEVMVRSLDRLR